MVSGGCFNPADLCREMSSVRESTLYLFNGDCPRHCYTSNSIAASLIQSFCCRQVQNPLTKAVAVLFPTVTVVPFD